MTVTVDFLRDRIRHDRDAGDLRPLGGLPRGLLGGREPRRAGVLRRVPGVGGAGCASGEATILNRSGRRSSILSRQRRRSGDAHRRRRRRRLRRAVPADQGARPRRTGRRAPRRGHAPRAPRRAQGADGRRLADGRESPPVPARGRARVEARPSRDLRRVRLRRVRGRARTSRCGSSKARRSRSGSRTRRRPRCRPTPPSTSRSTTQPEPPSPADTLAESSASARRRSRRCEIVRIMERAARAIHAAHEAGVIHRDLKPGNIMVDASGEPVVLDFGLARDLEGDGRLDHEERRLPRDAGLHVARADRVRPHPPRPAQRRLLARRHALRVPHAEAAVRRARRAKASTRRSSRRSRPTRAGSNKAISPDLKVVLETALNKDRDRRYVSAEAFADDLRRVRELKPIQAKPISPLGRLVRWAKRNPLVAGHDRGRVPFARDRRSSRR